MTLQAMLDAKRAEQERQERAEREKNAVYLSEVRGIRYALERIADVLEDKLDRR